MLKDLFSPRLRLLQQDSEIKKLRAELGSIKQQNDSMRQGMRRCVTCEYRIAVRDNQDQQLDPIELKE
jgi:hypothetical protein